MFDSTLPIELSVRTATGKVPIQARWPTDEEWIARFKGRKTIFHMLGRGASQAQTDSREADLKLFQKISQNGAPTLTGSEASLIVEAMARCVAIDVVLEGNEAVVELDVPSGSVKHHLRIPSADQVLEFRRMGSRATILPFNKHETRLNVDVGARLWDTCGGHSDDYVGGVPAPHKDQAIRSLLDALDQEMTPRHDEANF